MTIFKSMKNQKILPIKIYGVLILSLFLSAFSLRSFALGFGEIQLFSYINEPLQAEIELLGAEALDPQRIMVSLASTQEFKRAGLDRPFFLSQLKFTVARSGQKTLIQVNSEQPIRQAYLDFLIDLTSPEGRLLRGYTILLDPPPTGRVTPPVVSNSGSQKAQVSKDGVSLNKKVLELQAQNLSGKQKQIEKSISLTRSTAPSATQQRLENLFDPQDLAQAIKIEEPLAPMTIVSKVTSAGELGAGESEEAFNSDTENINIVKLSNREGSDAEQGENQELQHTLLAGSAVASGKLKQAGTDSAAGRVKKDYLKPVKILKKESDKVLRKLKIGYLELTVLAGGLTSILISFVFLLYFIKSRRRLKESPSVQTQKPFSFSLSPNMQTQVWAEEEDPAELSNPLTKPFTNEMAMKLDLAKHYREVGETSLVLSLLDDVIVRGSPRQREEATQLLHHILQQEQETAES